MPELTMLDWALTYSGLGWRIFPLQPRTKNPFPDSHGCHDATTDPDQIREWWRRWPAANIGVATGAGSNLAVVDLDIGKGKDGIAEYRRLAAGREPVKTAWTITGGGGKQLFFEFPAAGLRNSQGKIAKGIDTRGEGGYVVAAPSIHPSGQAYRWGEEPEAAGLATLPSWLMPSDNLAGAVDLSAKPLADRPAPEAVERARLYLETLPDAISGQGGHNATFEAACYCWRFGLTESQAWDLLNWFNDRKCQPKWSERELRHKLKSSRATVEKAGQFGSKIEEPDPSPSRPRITVAGRPEPESGQESGQSVPTAEPFPIDVERDTFGLVGDICRWMLQNALKPQPVLALANTVAFLGAVMGRRVRTATDLRTNFYCLGVGESGCGKDHSRKCVKRICEAANLTAQVLGGEELASDSAIESAVFANPSILFQLDEIGHMLSQVNSKYAANHERGIGPTFMKLFSSANVTLIGKERVGRDRTDIAEPNVCIYGTTVGSQLYNGLTVHDIGNGFLNRFLVFESADPDPAERDAAPTDPPDKIIAAVSAWHKLYDSLPPARWDKANRQAHCVPANGEATAALKRFAAESREYRAANRDGRGLDALWARAVEHARKLALLVACACVEPDESGAIPVSEMSIDGTSAEFAVKLVRHLTRSLVDAARDNVTDSEFGRAIQRVKKAIYLSGGGLTLTQLGQKTQGMPPRVRRDALDELLLTGAIVMAERQTGDRGPATRVYAKTTHMSCFSPN